MTYPSAVFSWIVGPVRVETADNNQTILTHLQKLSRCGFLVTWPFCFHIWFFWKKQEFGQFSIYINSIYWKPGTERGIYMRTPGFRWDAELGMTWTWGYIGGHWD